ncbi:hypothetical protein [Streptomyces sp. NBC_01176]|uniref:hypothetical protein n=1 Tax=Streptomyces sp. NBC_01176 TaxID=2903760 RepID=UPI0038632B35|nr:hypothetical protein OG199_26530 [Streptomyces sp. NBC_01176]
MNRDGAAAALVGRSSFTPPTGDGRPGLPLVGDDNRNTARLTRPYSLRVRLPRTVRE